MVTFEKARKIAAKLKPNIGHCTETTDAYLFGSSKDDWAMTGEGPVAVMKENGKAYDIALYRAISRWAKDITTFDLCD